VYDTRDPQTDPPNVIDQAAHDIAVRVISGHLPEQRGRWEIGGLIHRSTIPRGVAARIMNGWTPQAQEDAAEIVADILVEKIAGPIPALDIPMIAANKSFSGWARRFAQSASMSYTVSRQVHRSRELLCESPTKVNDIGELDSPTDDRFAESASNYSILSRGLTSTDLVAVRAKVLSDTYGAPLPVRWVGMSTSKALHRRLRGSNSAVKDDIRESLEDPGSGLRGLAGLWSEAREPELNLLVDLPTLVAQAIAEHALTPIAPIATQHIRKMCSDITLTVGNRSVARTLVNNFAGVWAELDGRWRDTARGAPPKLKTQATQNRDRESWEQAVSTLLTTCGVTALGRNASDVYQALTDVLWGIRLDGGVTEAAA